MPHAPANNRVNATVRPVRRTVGALLTAAGCIGFLTIADDFDHTGELFGVAGILVAGLVLLLDGSNVFFSRRLALHWVAIGIGVGEVVGAIAGSLPTGVSGGALLGTFAAALFGSRQV